MRPILPRLALSALLASPSLAQDLIVESTYDPRPSYSWMRYGAEIETVGDLDGDGLGDLAVHVHPSHFQEPAAGWIRVISSATGRPLLSVRLSNVEDTVVRFADAGDVDRDGVPDLLVGFSERHYLLTVEHGQVHVYSGRTGKRLYLKSGSPSTFHTERLGSGVAGAGDVNGDGYADFSAGAPGYDTNGQFGFQPDAGAVYVWSGKDGSLLDFVFAEGSPRHFGYDLANVGDQNGDGRDELIATVPGSNSAYRFSPGTGGPLMTLYPPGLGYAPEEYGARVVALGDQDGDGLGDVAISDPEGKVANQPEWGLVSVQRAVDGAHLGTYSLPSFLGFDEELYMGRVMAAVGDADGDGREDLVAAGWMEDPAHAPNPTSAPCVLWSPSTDDILLEFGGGAPEWFAEPDWSPADFAAAGDSDGNGRHEFFMARSSVDTSFGPYAGRIDRMEYEPLFGNGVLENLGSYHPGHAPGFGSAVDLIPDLDGDGAPEWIVGAPHHGASSSFDNGRVQVISAGTVLHEMTGASLERVGAAVCAIDDVTGDRIADFLVGKPGAKVGQGPRGSATLHSGADASVVRTHLGQDAYGDFGASVAAVPDLDGDGVRDYAIGAPFAADLAGRVRVFSGAGGAELWSAEGPYQGRLGSSLAGSADVDGDGRGDLIVGAPGSTWFGALEAGRAVRYSGSSGAVIDVHVGAQGYARLGAAVASVGDVNGDGVSDFLVGSPGHDGSAADDGLAELRSGASGNLLATFQGLFGERLGSALGAAGDVDHDGVPDFALGAPAGLTDFLNGERAGRVRVVSGATLEDARVLYGVEHDSGFGSAFGSGGFDVDGDGLPDLAIGVPNRVHPVEGPLAPDEPAEPIEVGDVQIWSLRAAGTEPYGAGTPGCGGAHLLAAAAPVFPGQTLDLRLDGLGPGAVPLMMAATNPNPAGVPFPGTGALLHLDLFTVLLIQAGSPATGTHASRAIPIPNNPGLVGFTVHLQELVLWPAPCPAVPLSVSSSNGLSVTIQG